ncbi:MAG TPA: 50S ribosomal protein L25 [Ktedonobacteraceae bacterium]|nr:50S ribosomal protein L25 [Ktedonobacteraceae bacterium]
MPEQTELAVTRREATGKAVKRLRKVGLIPANIYGHQETPEAVQIDAIAFTALRKARKTNNIISLRMNDGTSSQTALVRHIQRNPINGKILHIDFFRVSLTERIVTKVTLRVVGEAPGVKNENGVLLHLLEALEVECAAQDIVNEFDVDVTTLEHIDDTLHASDVKLPEGFKLITDPEEAIVKIAATRAEKAEEAEEAAAAATTAEAAAAATETSAEE